jgi:hypothetical protein
MSHALQFGDWRNNMDDIMTDIKQRYSPANDETLYESNAWFQEETSVSVRIWGSMMQALILSRKPSSE